MHSSLGNENGKNQRMTERTTEGDAAGAEEEGLMHNRQSGESPAGTTEVLCFPSSPLLSST